MFWYTPEFRQAEFRTSEFRHLEVKIHLSELGAEPPEFRHSELGLGSRNSVAKPWGFDIRRSDFSIQNFVTPKVGTPAVGTLGGNKVYYPLINKATNISHDNSTNVNILYNNT